MNRRIASCLLLSLLLLACGDENKIERSVLFTGLWKLPSATGQTIFLELEQDDAEISGNFYLEISGLGLTDPIPLRNGRLSGETASFDLDVASIPSDNPALNASTVATRACAIEVLPAPLQIIDRVCPLPAATLDSAYADSSIRATGGIEPYEWSASGLPPGLSMDTLSAIVAGTPTEAGSYPFTVTVVDSDGVDVTASCTLLVEEDISEFRASTREGAREPLDERNRSPRGPSVWELLGAKLTADIQYAPVAIDTSTPVCPLPTATEEDRYESLRFRAIGGVPPYTWTARDLPAGLGINPVTGKVEGSPRQHGTFDFEVMVIDAAKIDSIHMAATLENPSLLTIRITACVEDTCFVGTGLGERQVTGFKREEGGAAE